MDRRLRGVLERVIRHPLVTLARQFTTYVSVSLCALAVHYGVLAALVEGWRVDPVAASLTGAVLGGVVSYTLNRRHTYASARPHGEAVWRFSLVAAFGLVLTGLLMGMLTRWAGLGYMTAQVITTGIVVFWNFSGNKLWTFAERERLADA